MQQPGGPDCPECCCRQMNGKAVYMESMIRLLKADEIECGAASVSEKGLSLLLYKDARVDQKILDETFGC